MNGRGATCQRLWTVRDIAKRARSPKWRVRHVILTLGIKPIAFAAHYRVFSPADVRRIIRRCRELAARRVARTGQRDAAGVGSEVRSEVLPTAR